MKNIPICLNCGNQIGFMNLDVGYKRCNECHSNNVENEAEMTEKEVNELYNSLK